MANEIILGNNYNKAIKTVEVDCLHGIKRSAGVPGTHIICFVHSGGAFLSLASDRIAMSKGDVFIIPPGREYSVETSAKGDELYLVKMLVVWPDTVFFPYGVIHVDDFLRIYEIIKKLHYYCGRNTSQETRVSCLSVLLSELVFCQNQKQIRRHSKLAGDIRAWIRMHLFEYEDINAGLEKKFGYSRNYIGRLFIREYGQSASQYVSELKIGHAVNLLTNTPYSVSRISEILKFSSPDSFVKFFKYHMNVTPGRLRKQLETGSKTG
ncbi:MAG: helix-turn-helix transcriptional regulator [Clostridia bacterium]|nr:helix-turn-helix transcriptional regulator [Clostridia bacterium]